MPRDVEDDTIKLVLSGLTLSAIQAEATRAHFLHGNNSMLFGDQSQERRLAILTEEVGEVAKELNEASIRATQANLTPRINDEFLDRDALVKELIQVAAMAASWVEALEGIR